MLSEPERAAKAEAVVESLLDEDKKLSQVRYTTNLAFGYHWVKKPIEDNLLGRQPVSRYIVLLQDL